MRIATDLQISRVYDLLSIVFRLIIYSFFAPYKKIMFTRFCLFINILSFNRKCYECLKITQFVSKFKSTFRRTAK